MAMIDKLNVIFQRYNEVNDLIIQPDVISDSKRYVQLNSCLLYTSDAADDLTR